MKKLTDNQVHILKTASSRADKKIEPLPIDLKGGAKKITLLSLKKRQLIEEVKGEWVVTEAGCQIVTPSSTSLFDANKDTTTPDTEKQEGDNTKPINNIDKATPPEEPPTHKEQASQTNDAHKPKNDSSQKKPKVSKRETLLSMISRERGASLQELCDATTWKENSVRGTISTLNKSMQSKIISERIDGKRHYRIQLNAPKDETS